ncbi:hypothetical protein KCU94_g21106, partial [Aureobasidium melanogenum]
MTRSISPSSSNTLPKEKSSDDIASTSPQQPPPDEEAAEIAKEKEQGDPFLVGWDPGERNYPMNWSSGYKAFITFILGMLALAASLGSSIISPAEQQIAEYTGIS